MTYYLHGPAGGNLHYKTRSLPEAKQYADSKNYKVTVSIQYIGNSPWNGKPCKMFKQVYNNGKD